MRTKIVFSILLLFASTFVTAQDDIEKSTLLKKGDRMPAFTAEALSGESVSSGKLTGKVILINFWATWCGPCRAEFPLLQKDIYDSIKDPDFLVMAISRGEVADTVRKFIDRNKYTFPIYVDKEAKVYNLFANKYIPRNFVIGKDGKIKWVSTGFQKEEFYEMVGLIKEELKK